MVLLMTFLVFTFSKMVHFHTMYLQSEISWTFDFLISELEEEVQLNGLLDFLIYIHWIFFFGGTYKVSVLQSNQNPLTNFAKESQLNSKE